MKVKLPGSFTSKQIVDAFVAASTIQVNEDVKFVGEEFIGSLQYEPGSVHQTVRNLGAIAYRYFYEKRWIFFGRKIWKKNVMTLLRLDPLSTELDKLSGKHTEVDITFKFWVPFANGGAFEVSDPQDPSFKEFKPLFEKIIANFYEQLKATAATA